MKFYFGETSDRECRENSTFFSEFRDGCIGTKTIAYRIIFLFMVLYQWFLSGEDVESRKKKICQIRWKSRYVSYLGYYLSQNLCRWHGYTMFIKFYGKVYLPLTSWTHKISFNSSWLRFCGIVLVTTIFLIKLTWVRIVWIESPENSPWVAKTCRPIAPDFLRTWKKVRKNYTWHKRKK